LCGFILLFDRSASFYLSRTLNALDFLEFSRIDLPFFPIFNKVLSGDPSVSCLIIVDSIKELMGYLANAAFFIEKYQKYSEYNYFFLLYLGYLVRQNED